MKVKDLIEKLQALPPELIVVQSRDAEGNSFSPVAEVTEGVYVEETTYSGEFSDNDEDVLDYTDRGGEGAICLWPTN
jgi:hypothetical protein